MVLVRRESQKGSNPIGLFSRSCWGRHEREKVGRVVEGEDTKDSEEKGAEVV